MNLLSIPSEQKIIIDANIFIYANLQASSQCVKLLERCSRDEVYGIIPTHILAEVMHVLNNCNVSSTSLWVTHQRCIVFGNSSKITSN